LAIGAHPDDVEIGCGGILLRHCDAGHSITIVSLTEGERGGDAELRRAESRNAAALLSARAVMLDLGDTAVPEGGATIEALSEIVDEVRPTTVYTHTFADTHQDHRSVHRATVVGARAAQRLYAYQSPSSTVDFRPQVFVSVDDVLERKLALIAPHLTQNSVREYLAPDLICATARYWGRFGSSDYAEPLEVIRQADVLASRSGRLPDTATIDTARLDHATP
ncbi:MAG: PIG-L deacetylase family protein, partial [Solirubrobacteraceae bacterium]